MHSNPLIEECGQAQTTGAFEPPPLHSGPQAEWFGIGTPLGGKPEVQLDVWAP